MGKPGMRLLSNYVPDAKSKNIYDLICINGENSAGGFGITRKGAVKLKRYGCDVITTGNHIIDRKEEIESVFNIENVIRPINYESYFPGKGWTIIDLDNCKIAVINLQGTVFMPEEPKTENPFKVISKELDSIAEKTPNIIIDMHAEATAEKIAMRHFLSGKISALIGTHTHVQTADEIITRDGTAYITDVGMTGPFDSVIGMEAVPIIKKFLGGNNEQFKLAKKNVKMNAVEFEINGKTGKAKSIRRIEIGEDSGR